MLNLAVSHPNERHEEPPKGHMLKPSVADEAHVAVPDAVDVPLPKTTVEEISVPASINGRDLSKGKP